MEGIDSGRVLYPRSFEASSFTAETIKSFVGDSFATGLFRARVVVTPIDVGIVLGSSEEWSGRRVWGTNSFLAIA